MWWQTLFFLKFSFHLPISYFSFLLFILFSSNWYVIFSCIDLTKITSPKCACNVLIQMHVGCNTFMITWAVGMIIEMNQLLELKLTFAVILSYGLCYYVLLCFVLLCKHVTWGVCVCDSLFLLVHACCYSGLICCLSIVWTLPLRLHTIICSY